MLVIIDYYSSGPIHLYWYRCTGPELAAISGLTERLKPFRNPAYYLYLVSASFVSSMLAVVAALTIASRLPTWDAPMPDPGAHPSAGLLTPSNVTVSVHDPLTTE